MTLPTADERALLGQYSVVNTAVNLAQRLTDASTLQCVGDTATGHVRLVNNVQPGDSVAVFAGGGFNRQAAFVVGSLATYEFSSTGVVTPSSVEVSLGVSSAESASNLASVVARTQYTVIKAEAHPLDTNVVDIVHIIPGGVLTLSVNAQAASRVMTQSNNEGLAPAEFLMIMRKRTISNEDVVRGRIRFDTGWSSIVEGFASLYRSSTDQTPENFNGTVTMNYGILELSQGTGTGQYVQGNIMHLILLGTR